MGDAVTRDSERERCRDPRILKPLHHCGVAVKVGLASLSAGTAIGSMSTRSYHKISLGGRPVAEEGQLREDKVPKTEQGMAIAASSGRWVNPNGELGNSTIPIRNIRLRQETTSVTEAVEYIALCRGMGGVFFWESPTR